MTNTTVYPHCVHCYHDSPWGGSESLTADGEGHTVPCYACAPELDYADQRAHDVALMTAAEREAVSADDDVIMRRCPRDPEPHSLAACLAAEHERQEGEAHPRDETEGNDAP